MYLMLCFVFMFANKGSNASLYPCPAQVLFPTWLCPCPAPNLRGSGWAQDLAGGGNRGSLWGGC